MAFTTEPYAYTETAGSTYEWIITGGIISSGQGTATAEVVWSESGSGSISVQETNADNCEGEVVALNVVILPTSIDEIQDLGIAVYPNPANDIFTLEVPAGLLGTAYRIHDSSGKKVAEGFLSSAKTQIDVTTLANGRYTVVVIDDKLISIPVVVER